MWALRVGGREWPYHGLRTVLRTESDDFIHWSEPVEIMRGQDEHDQRGLHARLSLWQSLLGLPAQFHKGNLDARDWDTVTTELAWSCRYHSLAAHMPRSCGDPAGARALS